MLRTAGHQSVAVFARENFASNKSQIAGYKALGCDGVSFSVAHTEYRGSYAERTAGCLRQSGIADRATYRHRPACQQTLNGLDFPGVIIGKSAAVAIDHIEVGSFQSRVADGLFHGASEPDALRFKNGTLDRIGGLSASPDRRVHPGIALAGAGNTLHHKCCRSFSQN